MRIATVRRIGIAAIVVAAVTLTTFTTVGAAFSGPTTPNAPATLVPRHGGVGGFRLAYSDPAAAAADAADHRIIVLNADAARHISTIRAKNPEALVLVYQEASFTTDWDPTGISRGVGFAQASAHPEWFLLDGAGRRIESNTWHGNFLMDLTSPSYQKAWGDNVAAELASQDWDGVFIDDVNWRADFAGVAPARFPTDRQWRAATRSFLANVTPRLRSGGKLAVLNIGSAHAAPDLWADWLQFADGAMEEHFSNWSSKTGGPFIHDWGATGWKAQIDNAATAERMGKISMLRVGGVEGDVEAIRYGLASSYLVNEGRSTVAPPRFEAPPSYPEQTWDLGRPLAPYRQVQTNVYRRDFTSGSAIVNASEKTTVTIELGGTHLDHAGQRITRITLGPTRGAILRKVASSTSVRVSETPSGVERTWLSSLTPSATPANGWGPYERDRANGETAPGDGARLSIGNARYDRGLGVHAGSDLQFAVPASCTFSADIGVDDEVGSRGSVVFEVWNGTASRLYQSPVLTGADARRTVRVPLTGVRTLRLVVTDAGDGDSNDHADWADASLACGS